MIQVSKAIRFLLLASAGTVAFATAADFSPDVAVDEIINESYHFLREREPDMTASEYALYERIVPMVFDEPEFALTLLETMIEDEEPESAAFEFVLGNVYYGSQRIPEAIAHYRKAVESYPEFLRAWTNLGVVHYSQDDFSEAVVCFTKALALGDQQPRTYGLLGYCHQQLGNLVAAELSYMQAFTLDPANTTWIQGLLNILLQSGQYLRAEPLVRQLTELEPHDQSNWILYANTLLAQERVSEAIAVLDLSIQVDATHSEAYRMLGELFLRQELYAEAVSVFERLAALAPEDEVQRLIGFSRALIIEGQYQQAAALLDRVDPLVDSFDRTTYLFARAELASRQDQPERACDALDELLQLDPLNGEALIALGQAHEKLGETARAEFNYEQAKQLPATAFRACLQLANLALQGRDRARAVAYLEEALSYEQPQALRDYLARIRPLVTPNK